MMELEKLNLILSIIFYFVLIIGIFLFVYNYAFIDWDKLGERMEESIEDISKSIHCEIRYGDFYYSGFCTDNSVIFEFLNNESRCYDG